MEGTLINQSGETFWWADSLVSYGQKVDLCKKKMRPVTRLCIWGKRQKKSAKKNILGSRRPPFPSPQSTARPSNFFYPVSLRFFAIFFPHSRARSQSTMDWTHSCTYKSLKQYEKEWRNIPEQDMFHKTQISRWFWWSANTHWEHSGKKKHVHISDLCMQCYD